MRSTESRITNKRTYRPSCAMFRTLRPQALWPGLVLSTPAPLSPLSQMYWLRNAAPLNQMGLEAPSGIKNVDAMEPNPKQTAPGPAKVARGPDIGTDDIILILGSNATGATGNNSSVTSPIDRRSVEQLMARTSYIPCIQTSNYDNLLILKTTRRWLASRSCLAYLAIAPSFVCISLLTKLFQVLRYQGHRLY
jgi:hypothetical protein